MDVGQLATGIKEFMVFGNRITVQTCRRILIILKSDGKHLNGLQESLPTYGGLETRTQV